MTTQITDSNFDSEVLGSDKIVFVECFADWCEPCKALKPLLVEIANANPDTLKLGLLDVECNPNLSERLKITSIPKVVIFKNGEQVTEILGVRPKKDYQDIIGDLK